jgi:hypothetical protein
MDYYEEADFQLTRYEACDVLYSGLCGAIGILRSRPAIPPERQKDIADNFESFYEKVAEAFPVRPYREGHFDKMKELLALVPQGAAK